MEKKGRTSMVAQTLEDSRMLDRERGEDENVKGRGGWPRESGRDRWRGTGPFSSYLQLPIYRISNPSGFPFAPGPRRLRRLNAINDLIPVITVLIYREQEGADLPSRWRKLWDGARAGREPKFLSIEWKAGKLPGDDPDPIDKTLPSRHFIYLSTRLCIAVYLPRLLYIRAPRIFTVTVFLKILEASVEHSSSLHIFTISMVVGILGATTPDQFNRSKY